MKKIILALSALISNIVYSQNVSANYTFSNPANSTFTAITGTTVHASGVDDALSASIALPFSFQYGCVNQSNIKISSNGWMTFNTGLSTSYATNDLDNASNGIVNPLIIAPLWDDNQVWTTGAISYTTTGTAPNRIFIAQWLNMEWDYFAGGAVMSFQVWLYETTNVIEFRYRRDGTAVSAGGASIGLMGATTGDFISINTTPAASTVTETSNITTKPAKEFIDLPLSVVQVFQQQVQQ